MLLLKLVERVLSTVAGVNVPHHQPRLSPGADADSGTGVVAFPPQTDCLFIHGGVQVPVFGPWVLADIQTGELAAGAPAIWLRPVKRKLRPSLLCVGEGNLYEALTAFIVG